MRLRVSVLLSCKFMWHFLDTGCELVKIIAQTEQKVQGY